MDKWVLSAALVLSLVVPLEASERHVRTEAVNCQDLADDLNIPAHLRDARHRPPLWEQVDVVLVRVIPALQGQQCSFRFEELFKGLGEDEWLPLTNRLLAAVPRASLQGQRIWSSSGVPLGSFLSVVSEDSEAPWPAFHAFYSLRYRSNDGAVNSSGRSLLQGSLTLKWADAKGKVAVDTTGR